MCETRETREGWPLLTVETEANGDSYKWTGSSMVGSLGSSSRYTRFLSCLGCFSGPSTQCFFPHLYSISVHLSTSPSKLGQAVVPSHLSLSMCLCLCETWLKHEISFPCSSPPWIDTNFFVFLQKLLSKIKKNDTYPLNNNSESFHSNKNVDSFHG
jgi:hypothetical protein